MTTYEVTRFLCAWCRRETDNEIPFGEPWPDDNAWRNLPGVSHGCCVECSERLIAGTNARLEDAA